MGVYEASPRTQNMASPKSHFLKKKISTDLSEILMGDVKLLLDNVLKAYLQYIPQFLSYQENPEGSIICPPPPPNGAGVNNSASVDYILNMNMHSIKRLGVVNNLSLH